MFDVPSRKTVFVAPSEPIDVDQRYLVRLMNIVDEGVSKFADPAKNEKFHNLRWHFRVARADTKEPILTADDEPWEHVQWTTSKTGKSPNGGMTATARLWIEALLGHPIEDEDITPDMPDQIMGKIASCLFESKEATTLEGETYTKLSILRLSPYRGDTPKPAPKPAPKTEDSLAF